MEMSEATKRDGQVNLATHPSFVRLMQEGFTWVDEEDLNAFLAKEGLKMLIFADDPNARRVTIDIAVIAPELKKAFAGTLSATAFARFGKSRAMASRFGLSNMPAVAIFMGADLMGAVQGLKDWNGYCEELTKILTQPSLPKKRITLVAGT